MARRYLAYSSNEHLLLGDRPPVKFIHSVMKVLGVENLYFEFRKARLYRKFKSLPLFICGGIAAQESGEVLFVFATVVQVTNEHSYPSPSQKAGRHESVQSNRGHSISPYWVRQV